MSTTIVGILGIITIVGVVVLLFQSKTQPAIAFISVPSILALILVLGGYIKLSQVKAMIQAGFSSTSATATLFVFSVLFFGVMTDAGMFDVIISKLMKLVGKSVMGVCIVTAVISIIGHLDGGGASTFCIVIPSLMPVFRRMHMRPTSLLRIAVLSMGVLNLMPWAGPTMRAATVLGVEVGGLWHQIIPIQIFGICLAFAVAIVTGIIETRRGAGVNGKLSAIEGNAEFEEVAQEAKDNELARPKLFIFNILLTIGVIALLIKGIFPDYVPFMLGLALALFVNYGFSANMHKKIINLHAGPALMMCSTLMGAAILMGILTTSFDANGASVNARNVMKIMDAETGILLPGVTPSVVQCIANIIKSILPEFLGNHLPFVIGILSVPLALAFDTDSYFYGMLPVIIAIGQSFGIQAMHVAVAMVVCRNCATFISPMVPATLLGVGLANVDIKDHIKANFLWVWGFSILCMIFAGILRIMPL